MMRVPFSNAWEYMQWDETNCCRCAKADYEHSADDMPCDLQRAISESACGVPVPDAIVKRLRLEPGYTPPECAEKEPADAT